MDLTNALEGIGAAVLENRREAGLEEIIGEDGMPYCKKCGEPLKLGLNFVGPMAERLGSKRYVPRNCECMRMLYAEEAAIHRKKERAEANARMRRENLKSEIYRTASFDMDDGRDPAIRKMCENYVAKREKIIANNMGIAFLGGNGGGKTFWASCIANAMIEAGSSVYMSTITNLIQDMNADYGENREAIKRKIKNVDFLIIDDYGAERGTEYSLEQAFEIIDTRYSVRKPLIITANLTENNLKNPSNMNYGRSYSRIIEMCPAVVGIESRRREEIADKKRELLREILYNE